MYFTCLEIKKVSVFLILQNIYKHQVQIIINTIHIEKKKLNITNNSCLLI